MDAAIATLTALFLRGLAACVLAYVAIGGVPTLVALGLTQVLPVAVGGAITGLFALPLLAWPALYAVGQEEVAWKRGFCAGAALLAVSGYVGVSLLSGELRMPHIPADSVLTFGLAIAALLWVRHERETAERADD